MRCGVFGTIACLNYARCGGVAVRCARYHCMLELREASPCSFSLVMIVCCTVSVNAKSADSAPRRLPRRCKSLWTCIRIWISPSAALDKGSAGSSDVATASPYLHLRMRSQCLIEGSEDYSGFALCAAAAWASMNDWNVQVDERSRVGGGKEQCDHRLLCVRVCAKMLARTGRRRSARRRRRRCRPYSNGRCVCRGCSGRGCGRAFVWRCKCSTNCASSFENTVSRARQQNRGGGRGRHVEGKVFDSARAAGYL